VQVPVLSGMATDMADVMARARHDACRGGLALYLYLYLYLYLPLRAPLSKSHLQRLRSQRFLANRQTTNRDQRGSR
jgi:hypothetical protein